MDDKAQALYLQELLASQIEDLEPELRNIVLTGVRTEDDQLIVKKVLLFVLGGIAMDKAERLELSLLFNKEGNRTP